MARFKERSERLLQQIVETIGFKVSDRQAVEADVRRYLGAKEDYQTVRDIANAKLVLRQLQAEGKTWQEVRQVPLKRWEEHDLDKNPRHAPFHDILFVRRVLDEDDIDNVESIEFDEALPDDFRFHRFRTVKEGPGRGGFSGGVPEATFYPEMERTDDGYRAVLNLATIGGGEAARGPILSALPLNPDPAASSSCTCYLLNPSNLNYATAWTGEEWSDRPGDEGAALKAGEDVFSLLIASPAGKVYFLEKTKGTPLRGPISDEITFREVDLRDDLEVWSQLRNGCVVGRAMFNGTSDGKQKVTPLVNIHSLLPTPASSLGKV